MSASEVVLMLRPRLLDVVELTHDLPAANRRRGDRGTVVECLPDDAFLVEFEPGTDLRDLHEVAGGDLRVVWRLPAPVGDQRSSA